MLKKIYMKKVHCPILQLKCELTKQWRKTILWNILKKYKARLWKDKTMALAFVLSFIKSLGMTSVEVHTCKGFFRNSKYIIYDIAIWNGKKQWILLQPFQNCYNHVFTCM